MCAKRSGNNLNIARQTSQMHLKMHQEQVNNLFIIKKIKVLPFLKGAFFILTTVGKLFSCCGAAVYVHPAVYPVLSLRILSEHLYL